MSRTTVDATPGHRTAPAGLTGDDDLTDDLTDDLGVGLPEERRVRRVSVRRWVALLAVVLVAAASALTAALLVRPAYPDDASVEAGFSRDMQEHHGQAVEMSMIVRDRTDDDATRTLAYDIALTQQQQQGQMYAWLVTWGDSQARTGAAMQWMAAAHGGDMSTHVSTAAPGVTMIGMASDADLARLTQLSGRDAEVLYLQLMVAHHRGGVEMAQTVLGLTDRPEVVRLATAMASSQTSEIDLMNSMLVERGAAPA